MGGPGRRLATRVFIHAHGECPSKALIDRLAAWSELFIAADGAANRLVRSGVATDSIIGDFDSLSADLRKRLPSHQLIHAADQESSDLDKAIRYALSRGATEIAITGAAGGRIDHTLVNAALLIDHHGQADIALLDDRGSLRLVTQTAEISGRVGDTLSLMVFAPAHGVTLTGVRWPLSNETLYPGSRGVSNVLSEPTVRLTVRDGAVFLAHLHAAADVHKADWLPLPDTD